MTSDQKYDGKANNAQPNDSTVNSDQQTPFTTDQRQPLTAEEVFGAIDGALTLLQNNQFGQAEAVLLQMKGRMRSLPIGQVNALQPSAEVQPVASPVWFGTDLFEHLSDEPSRRDARQMVRAWYLSHLLRVGLDLEPMENPCEPVGNAYMYESLDSFMAKGQMPASADEWFATDLGESLESLEDREQARLMLRSWFLAYTLTTEFGAPLNPCELRVNVYLFESLDSFLSDPSGKEVAGE